VSCRPTRNDDYVTRDHSLRTQYSSPSIEQCTCTCTQRDAPANSLMHERLNVLTFSFKTAPTIRVSTRHSKVSSHHTIHFTRPVDRGERGKFSRAPQHLGARHHSRILKRVFQSPDGFFLTSNMHKIHFLPGLRPGPGWGSLRRSLRPIVVR